MATIKIAVGTGEYGIIYGKDGSSASTLFWHVAYFPVIPIGGRRIVAHGGSSREESGLVPLSLLLALFNAWGLVALVVLGSMSWSHHDPTVTVAAIALMLGLFVSWFAGGGVWRLADMQKRNLWWGGTLFVIASLVSTALGVTFVQDRANRAESESAARWAKTSPEDRLKALASMVGTLKAASEAGDRAEAKAKCDAGSWPDCVALGKLFELGKDGPRDIAAAVALYQRACDAHAQGGCARLGFLTRYGDGVKADPARAVQLLTPACEATDGWACFHLGEMAAMGSGMPRDPAAATRFRQRGCELGFEGACKAR